MENMENIWNEIILKTRLFVEGVGFEKALLGISGGIDSAVVACIGTKALHPENLLAVMMPSPYSSRASVSDAVALAENWGFKTATIPIEPLMNSFDTTLSPFFDGCPKDSTEENIQARIRAVLLMALSNKHTQLLLNTCNKSEDYTGFCTLYGDSCGAVAPIGDLYKTEVYALARWINENPDLPNIPEQILAKEPSAELRENQVDTDSLPPYEQLDAILNMVVDKQMTPAEVIESGVDEALVARVVELINSSAFKREQSPPVIEIEGER